MTHDTHNLPREILIVANPFSGAKENRGCVEGLAAALRKRDLDCRIVWDLGEFVEITTDPAADERYRCVVAAGGDGTLNRVFNLQRHLPVFMFPLGNENLFSRQFGCCPDPQHAADVIEAGQTQAVDLGRAGDRLFAIVASAGFDGEAAHRLARWRQQSDKLRRVRSVSYATPILMSALRYRYPLMDIEADGQKLRGALCMVFNMPQYANKLPLAFDADPHDGLLDWVVFERPGNLLLARYALSVWLKQHRHRHDVRFGRAKRVVLGAAEPVPLEIDGEAAEFAPVTIDVIPQAVRIVVPPAACGCRR
ncbi:MAG TPA: diacylglycerol kinase family protein [Pirellulales bacterium]|nr:diacylglycerol kinase family protein [Pirellulales bacterium]